MRETVIDFIYAKMSGNAGERKKEREREKKTNIERNK